MSHLVETMAYVNATPWHGLGNQLPPSQPLEVWQRSAGMDWSIKESDVLYSVADVSINVRPCVGSKVLYRSDSLAPLSVVSERYKVVQPREVLEFYRDLVSAGGFELETAGVLKGGKKLWALAKTGQETVLKGGDRVKAYLLLATSCDGTLATTAQFTSVRVVCNNTLQMAVGGRSGAVKVPHSTKFDPAAVKRELGIGLSVWDAFLVGMRAMSERSVSHAEATRFLTDVLGDPSTSLSDQINQKAIQSVQALFAGAGKGAGLESADGTAWGILNAVTEYVDHERRSRSQDYRLDSAWFGNGAAIKGRALERALRLTV